MLTGEKVPSKFVPCASLLHIKRFWRVAAKHRRLVTAVPIKGWRGNLPGGAALQRLFEILPKITEIVSVHDSQPLQLQNRKG